MNSYTIGDASDNELERKWAAVDWRRAETALATIQRDIAQAARDRDRALVRELQSELTSSLAVRCLAVRHVTANPKAGCGIDGEIWRTGAQKMAAAIRLGDPYEARLQLLVLVTDNKGVERHVRIPTFYDRAMARLHAWALAPVTEASADKQSFASRKGRSKHDALKVVADKLAAPGCPGIVLVIDVLSFYYFITHRWLLDHVPMDKRVLRSMLDAGVVYAGGLFEHDEHGISLGNPLSPIIANFTLDGLQRAVYRALEDPDHPVDPAERDYANGSLVRFADDILITVRTQGDAARARGAVDAFCAERGLALNPKKTRVCSSDGPFDFLGYTFARKEGKLTYCPSEATVEAKAAELEAFISGWRRSERPLIEALNAKLKGWAGHYRYGDSADALHYIDVAVETALLKRMVDRHPKTKVAKLLETYWYTEPDGTHSYTLRDDRTVKVVHVSDTPVAQHRKINATKNYYLDAGYFDRRRQERDIANVAGPWRAVWQRTGGRCFYCGAPILADQPRLVVATKNAAAPTPKNAAYIHEACAFDEVREHQAASFDEYLRFDVLGTLKPIAAKARGEAKPIPANWRYRPLHDHFRALDKPTVTMSFKQVEKANAHALPVAAKRERSWWRPPPDKPGPARAWLEAGYEVTDVDFARKRVKFSRVKEGSLGVDIPAELATQRIPENAAFELERFFEYIIDKYGL